MDRVNSSQYQNNFCETKKKNIKNTKTMKSQDTTYESPAVLFFNIKTERMVCGSVESSVVENYEYEWDINW